MNKAILGLFIAWSSVAYAGVAENMGKFWNGMGGMSNSSGVSAHQAQSAGYYSLGNLYARTPVSNTQLLSVQLPSASGSCSDINLHNGAFSFINHHKLIETLKNISNNASGFAFQLGIETISPVIAEKIEELESWIQKINELNINSCEAAQTLVGGIWPRQERASQTICSVMANKSGIGRDYVEARHGCHEKKGKMLDDIKGRDSGGFDKLWVEDINIAWKALKDSGFLASDNSLAELFMTLSGTIIVKAPQGNEAPKFVYISGQAIDADMIHTLLNGGDIKYLKCSEHDKCLNVSQEHNLSIPADKAFKARVEKIVSEIADKIVRDEELSSEEKNFLNYKISVPLYKILNVYAAYSGANAMFELPAYTEAIALQIMFKYLEDVLNTVERATDSLIIADEDHLKEFKQRIRETRAVLNGYQLQTNQNLRTLMTLVDRAQMIESILAKTMDNSIADAFHWSKEL